ncbi:uncharacterized protein [Chelonus insularis]|uniref:uncharacterized protein n=1 Tax=Chelonus insularis TaxID=460826 RepID=UPI00158F25E0|nr:uncharacterized protein LOC118071806 [Chelonus insularis]
MDSAIEVITTSDINGGNTEVARNVDDPEVAATEIQKVDEETVVQQKLDEPAKMEEEVNGDVKSGIGKKSITPVAKRKLRKFKANSTSNVENEPANKKRKLSDSVISSEDSMDFTGFDKNSTIIVEAASAILQKLIAEAEALDAQAMKRMRRSVSKGPRQTTDNHSVTSNIPDANDLKMRWKDDTTDNLDKKEFYIDSDYDYLKNKDTTHNTSVSIKSPIGVNRQKGLKSTNFTSSGSATSTSIMKQKSVDITNPLFKEPFKYGWKRELIYNKGDLENSSQKAIKVFYITPKGNKKVYNLKQVAEHLNTKELTIDNFTFIQEPIGINDSECEIIREEDIVSTPVLTVSSSGGKKGSVSKRGGMSRRVMSGKLPSASYSPTHPVVKSSGKIIQNKTNISTNSKAKVIGRRGTSQQKKDVSPPKESDIVTSWNNSSSQRRTTVKKSTSSYKMKQSLKTKLQEPCSIRCSMSMGLIPSLQCCVCLCLYHPECVDHFDESVVEDYICKNCHQQENEETKKSNIMTPPPLIPISMINTSNSKSRYSSHESISKTSEKSSIEASNNYSISNKVDISAPWLSSRVGTGGIRDYISDNFEPKPAQNIAILSGKKYIVVPKNNAGAVQPAITAKTDKSNQPIPTASFMKDHFDRDSLSADKNSLLHQQQHLQPPQQLSEFQDKTMENKSVLIDNSNKQQEMTENILTQDASTVESCVDTLEKIHKEVISLNTTILCEDLNIDHDRISNDEVSNLSNLQNTQQSLINANLTITPLLVDNMKKSGLADQPQQIDQRQYFMSTVCAGYNALTRIFQYLKVQELLRAARVCKMWRDVAAHPALWKTVRMKNSQVTDWDGLVASLQRHGTQHLDLRKMLISGESDSTWKKFVSVIPNVTTLVKLELCKCPVMVVEQVIKACPQLEVLSSMTIKCEWLNLEAVGNLTRCRELKLKSISGMSLHGDLTPLQNLTQLTHLSLTSVKELGKKKIEVLGSLINLETLELGECSDFPSKFGTAVLCKLIKLERLRLEKGQGTCCTFDILNGVAKLEKLQQLELVNFDVKNGFDKRLASCKNIKRLLIIPTYISQSATSNNMVLGGVTELSNSLTHFVWGVTLELLRVTELFVDQCNQMNKQVSGDSIPVLKPVPCLKLIENVEQDEVQKGDEKSLNLPTPQVDILPLPQLQKLLLTALPKTRVKILKIPFHATWRQSISDTSSQS